MENPFESGHIKNYVLLYVSVVVIMVLFFIAASLFNDVENIEKKVFETEPSVKKIDTQVTLEEKKSQFKLLEVNSETHNGYKKGSKVERLEE